MLLDNKYENSEETKGALHFRKRDSKSTTLDIYYHLGLTSEDAHQFSNVNLVVFTSTEVRTRRAAKMFTKLSSIPCEKWGDDSRYELWRAGSILFCSHGLGAPSLEVILHEVTKLLWAAEAKGFRYICLGTCASFGLDRGTLVLTTQALDARLRPFHEQSMCGKVRRVSTFLHENLRNEILRVNAAVNCKIVTGKTIGCDSFYESQGRMDSAVRGFTIEEQKEYKKTCVDRGAVSIDLMSHQFASFCNDSGVPGASLGVVTEDRMKGDSLYLNKGQLIEVENAGILAVLRYAQTCGKNKYLV